MDILRRGEGESSTLGVLSGAFNPPTRAHLALASAALPWTGSVLFVLPRQMPHKAFDGATFDERLEMLLAATRGVKRFGVAVSEGGLLWEIARECRADYGADDVRFLCGRDAAERIIGWKYGVGQPSIEEQLREFRLLVAARQGEFAPPEHLGEAVKALPIDAGFDLQSATEVRQLAASNGLWEPMVPEAIVGMVRRIYRDQS